MAVWLVTGGNGFVGRHVLEALASGLAEPSRSDDGDRRAGPASPREAAAGIASSRPT